MTGVPGVLKFQAKTHPPESRYISGYISDRELAAVVDAWPDMPDHIQAAILSLVDANRTKKAA